MGISNGVGTLSGMVCPLIVGTMTKNKVRAWKVAAFGAFILTLSSPNQYGIYRPLKYLYIPTTDFNPNVKIHYFYWSVRICHLCSRKANKI